ncbi:DJ-1/PfpI family protein [Nonomuraea sp. NPDC050547]|uniref:DJ-1/PfpI family protein n=1 Tax=Nonomuraea sp. NPDC050547 TaxID=3364368 RepID=UPI00379D4299
MTQTKRWLRFGLHYLEMAVAMLAGMLLLGLLWDAVLPGSRRTDVDVLIMAADMTLGMALWMRVRHHAWPAIAEMSVAMIAPFLLLLVPYWLGVMSGHLVMTIGHVLMFVAMAAVMLWRREQYLNHRHRLDPRWFGRAGVVLVALLVPASVSGVNTAGKFAGLYAARADAVTVRPAGNQARHDPAKPTVALLAGDGGTNAGDLLGPYEVLAGSGRVNTYVVSPGARLVPLTGGLDLVPDLTFGELDRLLAGRSDTLDAVVVPALNHPAELGAITAWLRRQAAAGALAVSVCAGARTLAASGLLDGRPATSHWWRLPELRADFGKVGWVGGRRYVDDGEVISTAGVLSGIDGGLRVLERLVGMDAAREAARRVHWRHYTPGASGSVPVSNWEPADVAVVALNSSYQVGPSTIGVRLVEGTGELELASAFATYTEHSMVGRTVAVGEGPIRSRHGLTFVPRARDAGGLDRLLVPGTAAVRGREAGAEYLHTGAEFAFDPVLRDIARTYDVPTARWAAKTLEYPVMDVDLRGSGWLWPATIVALVLLLLGAAAAVIGRRAVRWALGRRRSR